MDTGHTAASPASTLVQVRTDDVVVLRPIGALDDALADDIRERALEAHAPVVIDLDACLQLDASAIDRITSSWTLFRPEMCFACGSVGDRRMLESRPAESALAVFASVEDAVGARGGAPGGWDVPDLPLSVSA